MITITQGGYHARHPKNVQLSRPNGISDYLLLVVKTAAVFQLEEETYQVAPNSAVLISPDTPSLYGNPDGEYIDDWLQFTAPANFFTSGQPLITNRFFPVTSPAHSATLIQAVLWETQYGLPDVQQENLTHLTRAVLNNLVSQPAKPLDDLWKNPYYTSFQSLRLALLSAPEKPRQPEVIAAELKISLSHFQHLYRRFFGISFQKDVIRLRIDKAKNFLATTDLTVEQIAELAGYHSEVHFYRQFQKETGLTPANYRNHHLAETAKSL